MKRIYGLIVFFLGVCILWQGSHLSVGSLRRPGPGFFPTVVAGVIVVLSLFLIIRGGKKGDEGQPFSAKASLRVLIVFASLVVYFFFLEYLGFIVVSFLLMTFLFVVMDSQRWYVGVLWGSVSTGLAYVLFEVLLSGNLPKGVLGI